MARTGISTRARGGSALRQLSLLAEWFGEELSGADLSSLVEGAVRRYGEIRVQGLDEVVDGLREVLTPADRARAHAALVEVAHADEVVHTMERTFLRHLADAWGLSGADD
ncbi:MAG: TerB family tellurite resistance protein [Bacteroidota bacterium]